MRQPPAPQTSVLVRNMPREFPREELESIFSKFGTPRSPSCRGRRGARAALSAR